MARINIWCVCVWHHKKWSVRSSKWVDAWKHSVTVMSHWRSQQEGIERRGRKTERRVKEDRGWDTTYMCRTLWHSLEKETYEVTEWLEGQGGVHDVQCDGWMTKLMKEMVLCGGWEGIQAFYFSLMIHFVYDFIWMYVIQGNFKKIELKKKKDLSLAWLPQKQPTQCVWLNLMTDCLTYVPCFSCGLACPGGIDIFQWTHHSQSFKYSFKHRKSYAYIHTQMWLNECSESYL